MKTSRFRDRSRSPISRWAPRIEVNSQSTGIFAPGNVINFEKCFYNEHPFSAARSQAEIDEFRERHNITLVGDNIPKPVFSFHELNLPEYIVKVFMKNGWKNPTPIQSQGWPMVLSGRDVVGIAQTGSGKTASYLVPALVHIAAQPRLRRDEGPICLVIVPTRELAQQVLSVATDFTIAAGLRTMCFYGGSSKGPQLRELGIGAEICISTPGRLLDFIQLKKSLLSRVTFLVLDEADRMLDMGFEPQIRQIVTNIRPDRQTVMWSATWPKDVQGLANDFIKNFIQVNIGSVSLHANPNITQVVEVMDDYRKENRLIQLLHSFGGARTIVFLETKRKTDRVAKVLQRAGFSVGAMHGDKQQREREATLRDIDDIQYVVNMDFPNQTEDYIHRIGRTARSDKKGTAFTFFTSKNIRQAKDLIDILLEANQKVQPELYTLASSDVSTRKTAFSKKYQLGKTSSTTQIPGLNNNNGSTNLRNNFGADAVADTKSNGSKSSRFSGGNVKSTTNPNLIVVDYGNSKQNTSASERSWQGSQWSNNYQQPQFQQSQVYSTGSVDPYKVNQAYQYAVDQQFSSTNYQTAPVNFMPNNGISVIPQQWSGFTGVLAPNVSMIPNWGVGWNSGYQNPYGY